MTNVHVDCWSTSQISCLILRSWKRTWSRQTYLSTCPVLYATIVSHQWQEAQLPQRNSASAALIRRPRSPCSLWNFAVKSSVLETRVMGLSSSEDRMIVTGVVLAWYRTVTDRRSDGQTVGQTVGQTESIMANTALCLASYADALQKQCEWNETLKNDEC